jgi:hypothetical protein
MKTVRSLSNAERGTRNAEYENDSQFIKSETSVKEEKKLMSETVEVSAIRNPQSAILLARPLLNWATRRQTENFVWKTKSNSGSIR